MYKVFAIYFLSIFAFSLAYGQSDDIKSYYNAYNFCAPKAQQQTMKKCNYPRMVEGFYTSCMSQKGFGDLDDKMDKARYAQYLETYRQCSVIANSAAQNQCNYGIVYNAYYNRCMSGYGFGSNGESFNEDDTAQQDPAPKPEKQERKAEKRRNPVGKFFDSII